MKKATATTFTKLENQKIQKVQLTKVKGGQGSSIITEDFIDG